MRFRPMVRPRRPLLRGAMIGGTAYAAGKARVRGQEREQDQEARLAQLEAEQAAQAPPMPAAPGTPSAAAPAAPAGTDIATQLLDLKKLLDQGVLSQAEFDAAKQKLLST